MNIGEKIKELRMRRRMTQADLAGDTVSRNMVSLIENGSALPSLQTKSLKSPPDQNLKPAQ